MNKSYKIILNKDNNKPDKKPSSKSFENSKRHVGKVLWIALCQ